MMSLGASPDSSTRCAVSPTKPEQRVIIKALDKSYNGFAPTRDAEHDMVRKLIAPFSTER